MKRRLIVAAVLLTAVGGGLAGTASAADQATRHKICVDHKVLLPDGLCVTWDSPAAPAPLS